MGRRWACSAYQSRVVVWYCLTLLILFIQLLQAYNMHIVRLLRATVLNKKTSLWCCLCLCIPVCCSVLANDQGVGQDDENSRRLARVSILARQQGGIGGGSPWQTSAFRLFTVNVSSGMSMDTIIPTRSLPVTPLQPTQSVTHSSAHVSHARYPFDTAQARRRFYVTIGQLRCLVCQNQSLADSNAPFALDLRDRIYHLMQAGKTDAQIRQFVLQRYGTFIFLRPPLESTTGLLWGLPLLLLSIIFCVCYRLRQPPP